MNHTLCKYSIRCKRTVFLWLRLFVQSVQSKILSGFFIGMTLVLASCTEPPAFLEKTSGKTTYTPPATTLQAGQNPVETITGAPSDADPTGTLALAIDLSNELQVNLEQAGLSAELAGIISTAAGQSATNRAGQLVLGAELRLKDPVAFKNLKLNDATVDHPLEALLPALLEGALPALADPRIAGSGFSLTNLTGILVQSALESGGKRKEALTESSANQIGKNVVAGAVLGLKETNISISDWDEAIQSITKEGIKGSKSLVTAGSAATEIASAVLEHTVTEMSKVSEEGLDSVQIVKAAVGGAVSALAATVDLEEKIATATALAESGIKAVGTWQISEEALLELNTSVGQESVSALEQAGFSDDQLSNVVADMGGAMIKALSTSSGSDTLKGSTSAAIASGITQGIGQIVEDSLGASDTVSQAIQAMVENLDEAGISEDARAESIGQVVQATIEEVTQISAFSSGDSTAQKTTVGAIVQSSLKSIRATGLGEAGDLQQAISKVSKAAAKGLASKISTDSDLNTLTTAISESGVAVLGEVIGAEGSTDDQQKAISQLVSGAVEGIQESAGEGSSERNTDELILSVSSKAIEKAIDTFGESGASSVAKEVVQATVLAAATGGGDTSAIDTIGASITQKALETVSNKVQDSSLTTDLASELETVKTSSIASAKAVVENTLTPCSEYSRKQANLLGAELLKARDSFAALLCAPQAGTPCPVSRALSKTQVVDFLPLGKNKCELVLNTLVEPVPESATSTGNQAPSLSHGAPPRAPAGRDLRFSLNGFDPDGDPLRYSCKQGCPADLTVNANTGEVLWTVDSRGVGQYDFIFAVSDGNQEATATVGITIEADDSNPDSVPEGITDPPPATGTPTQSPETNSMSIPAFNEDTEQIISLSFTNPGNATPSSCGIFGLLNVTETSPCSCSGSVCTVGVTGFSDYYGSNAKFDFEVVVGSQTTNRSTAFLEILAVDDPPIGTNQSGYTFGLAQNTTIRLDYFDPDGEIATACSVLPMPGLTETVACACDLAGICTTTVQGSTQGSVLGFDFNVTTGSNTSANALVMGTVEYIPIIDSNTVFTLDKGAKLPISSSYLSSSHITDPPDKIIYTLKTVPTHGVLKKRGQDLAVNAQFTQNELDNHLIIYSHDGSNSATDVFEFTVAESNGRFANLASDAHPAKFNISIIDYCVDKATSTTWSQHYEMIPNSYQICTVTQLTHLAHNCKNGTNGACALDFDLRASLDIGGTEFAMIGDAIQAFTGNFHGNGSKSSVDQSCISTVSHQTTSWASRNIFHFCNGINVEDGGGSS